MDTNAKRRDSGAAFSDGVIVEPTAEPCDEALVELVLAGETRAFTEIVQRYRTPLLRLAQSRLGSIESAEDAVQEAFLNAYKSLHTYRPTYRFRTWLWTILLNQCNRVGERTAKRLRHESSWEGAEDVLDAVAAESRDPSETVERREEGARLERMLRALPEVQADTLRLRFFGSLKLEEIATTMNCSLATVKNRLKAGLLKLAAHLHEEGGSTP